MDDFYVGDEVPKYSGYYFIPKDFKCDGCSTSDESAYVKVWLEIEERRLKAILTRDPETGKPSREIFNRTPLEPRVPDLHPLLHFKYRGFQAQARYNTETEKYDLEVHHIPDYFSFSHKNEKLLRDMFEFFTDDYLYLIGKGSDDKPSLHENLISICRHLPSDFEPVGERDRAD